MEKPSLQKVRVQWTYNIIAKGYLEQERERGERKGERERESVRGSTRVYIYMYVSMCIHLYTFMMYIHHVHN